MWIARVLLLLSAIMLAGCGANGGTPVVDTPTGPIQSDIRPGLEGIAQTGSLDSLGDIREAVEYGLKPVDAAKAAMLTKELDTLQSQSSREAAKAKAAEILSQL